jgi:hypothetical protein
MVAQAGYTPEYQTTKALDANGQHHAEQSYGTTSRNHWWLQLDMKWTQRILKPPAERAGLLQQHKLLAIESGRVCSYSYILLNITERLNK